jgi:battenin
VVGRLFLYTLAIAILLQPFLRQMLPIVLPLTYFLLLPRPVAFMDSPSPGSYAPLPEEDPDISVVDVTEEDTLGQPPKVPVFLTARDKWRLVKPMIVKYMLPLCKCSLCCVE